MKKIIITIFIILLGFSLIGQVPGLHYTVNSAQKALIIQDGKIIGEPKGPGLHFKIPYLQEVYKIDVEVIKKFSIKLPNLHSLQAIIMWQVEDPKKYYMSSRENNLPLKIESIVKPIFEKTMQGYKSEDIFQIYKGQQTDPFFSNPQHANILNRLQEPVEDYGISIYNIFFTSS